MKPTRNLNGACSRQREKDIEGTSHTPSLSEFSRNHHGHKNYTQEVAAPASPKSALQRRANVGEAALSGDPGAYYGRLHTVPRRSGHEQH